MNVTVAVSVAGLAGTALAGINVTVDHTLDNSAAFMNVSNLPEDGGAFQFGSGWGIPDLRAEFPGAGIVTMLPNTIGDPNEYWYKEAPGGDPTDPNNGGPGAPGNKIMEANLYREVGGGALSGTTLTFSGFVTDFSLTDAHTARVFIRDFAGDFSSFNESSMEITGTGAFSISLDTVADAGRVVQYGFQLVGVNVWSTDAAPFGSVTYSNIPAPGVAAMMGVAGLASARRRR